MSSHNSSSFGNGSSSGGGDQQRLRLVVMGDSFVGKSSIIKRFLFGTFAPAYTATVEDLFSRDYELGGTSLKVDILDTSGESEFPAMRRYIVKYLSFYPEQIQNLKGHV
jgi:small GTP-binding protein